MYHCRVNHECGALNRGDHAVAFCFLIGTQERDTALGSWRPPHTPSCAGPARSGATTRILTNAAAGTQSFGPASAMARAMLWCANTSFAAAPDRGSPPRTPNGPDAPCAASHQGRGDLGSNGQVPAIADSAAPRSCSFEQKNATPCMRGRSFVLVIIRIFK